MPPRRNSTSPSAAASRSGRPRTSRARRMIGSCRAASPRGGACSGVGAAQLDAGAARGSAEPRRSRPMPIGRARDSPEGTGCASAAIAKTERASPATSRRAAAARERWIGDLGERLDSMGEWRANAKREAGFRARAAGRRWCRGLRPMRHRFVESIIHEAFPSLALATPPIRPVTPPASPAPAIAWTDPARAARSTQWLARVGTRARRRSPRACGRRRATPAFAATSAPTAQPAAASSSWTRRRRRRTCGPFVHVAGLIAAAGLHAPARPRGRRGARLSPARRPRQRALPRGAAGCAGAAATCAAPTA